MEKIYTLRYRMVIEPGEFSDRDRQSRNEGLCDAVYIVTLTDNPMGGEEIIVGGTDGRNSYDSYYANEKDIFKVFLALAAQCQKINIPEWQKDIAQLALDCFLGMKKR